MMNKSNPLVSIAIPVYNGARYISKVIESALNQDYDNIEVVISDNNSTDNTLEILKNYSSNEKVKIFKNEVNIGMYPNFNKITDLCSGDYIKYLCSDDFLKKNAVSKMVEMFKMDEEISLVKTYSINVDTNGKEINKEKILLKKIKKGNDVIIKSAALITNRYCNTPSHVMIQRDIFIKNGAFPQEDRYFGWGNDMIAFLRQIKNKKIAFTDDRLLYRTLHDAQFTHKVLKDRKVYFSAINFIRKELLKSNVISVWANPFVFIISNLFNSILYLVKKKA